MAWKIKPSEMRAAVDSVQGNQGRCHRPKRKDNEMHWEYMRYDMTPAPERKRHYCHVPSTGKTIGFGSEADARNQCEAYAREGVTSYVLKPVAQCNPKQVAYQPEWVSPQ